MPQDRARTGRDGAVARHPPGLRPPFRLRGRTAGPGSPGTLDSRAATAAPTTWRRRGRGDRQAFQSAGHGTAGDSLWPASVVRACTAAAQCGCCVGAMPIVVGDGARRRRPLSEDRSSMMTLIRQVWLMLFGVLLFALVGSVATHTLVARQSLRTQLQLRNDDGAMMLALALSQQQGDAARMQLVAAAQFDTGPYRRLRLLRDDGGLIFERELPERPSVAPRWFVQLLPVTSAARSGRGVRRHGGRWAGCSFGARPTGRWMRCGPAACAWPAGWQRWARWRPRSPRWRCAPGAGRWTPRSRRPRRCRSGASSLPTSRACPSCVG